MVFHWKALPAEAFALSNVPEGIEVLASLAEVFIKFISKGKNGVAYSDKSSERSFNS